MSMEVHTARQIHLNSKVHLLTIGKYIFHFSVHRKQLVSVFFLFPVFPEGRLSLCRASCSPTGWRWRRRRCGRSNCPLGWGSRLYSFRVTPAPGDNYSTYCLSQSAKPPSRPSLGCMDSALRPLFPPLTQCEVVDCIVVGQWFCPVWKITIQSIAFPEEWPLFLFIKWISCLHFQNMFSSLETAVCWFSHGIFNIVMWLLSHRLGFEQS